MGEPPETSGTLLAAPRPITTGASDTAPAVPAATPAPSTTSEASASLNLAVLTVLAYAFAYLYEYVYAQTLNIPPHLIAVSPSSIVVAGISTVVFLAGTWATQDLYQLSMLALRKYPRGTNFTASSIILVLALWQITRPKDRPWKHSGVAFLGLTSLMITATVLVLTAVGFVLRWRAKRKTLVGIGEPVKTPVPASVPASAPKLLLREELRTMPLYARTVYSMLPKGRGRQTLFGLSVLFLALIHAQTEAQVRKDYTVLDGETESVVLRSYGDILVTATLNREMKTFSRVYVVRKLIGDDGSAQTRLHVEEELGPLRREP